MNFPVGVTEQLGLKLFWVGCPPGGAENIRKLRQNFVKRWLDPRKSGTFPGLEMTWTWQFPAIFTNLSTKKDTPLPWLFSNECFLNPSPRSHGSIVDSPPLNGELDHVTHTWSVLPAIAEVQKDILRSDGNIWKHPNRAVVHSVNNPFVSICSAICSEFMWIPVNPTTTCLHRVKRMVVNCPDFPPQKTKEFNMGWFLHWSVQLWSLEPHKLIHAQSTEIDGSDPNLHKCHVNQPRFLWLPPSFMLESPFLFSFYDHLCCIETNRKPSHVQTNRLSV